MNCLEKKFTLDTYGASSQAMTCQNSEKIVTDGALILVLIIEIWISFSLKKAARFLHKPISRPGFISSKYQNDNSCSRGFQKFIRLFGMEKPERLVA